MPTLFDYYRSSASYRVRIALQLKGIDYQTSSVHLLRQEQRDPAYRELNPAGLVPSYVDEHGTLTQSLAIIEYLEEQHPQPALLPASPADRAWVRSIALSVACDIHPLNNLRVLGYLEHELHVAEDARKRWYAHWVEQGLACVEEMLSKRARTSAFALGDSPTLADVCIVPQAFNARRFACNLSHVPRVVALDAHCASLPAFQRAAPEANEPR